MNALEIPHYFPTFLWKFWLADICHVSHVLRDPRIHAYDVYENELKETRTMPACARSAFDDFRDDSMTNECAMVLAEVESAFMRLESLAEQALLVLMRSIPSPTSDSPRRAQVVLDRHHVDQIRTYLVFLRFRNSPKYAEIVTTMCRPRSLSVRYSIFSRPFFLPVRQRVILEGMLQFFKSCPGVSACMEQTEARRRPTVFNDERDDFHRAMQDYCWKFSEAEVCIGLASEKQEYMMTDKCYGTLHEVFVDDGASTDLFFSIFPTLAVYILADPDHDLDDNPKASKVAIDYGLETPSDIHLRNAMLLQTYPRRLYFCTLLSVTQSISSYDEFRWIPEHQDYSRLKQRCRQKHTIEGVKKTLLVKGRVVISDLTDEVVKSGREPLYHGSFSDVWKGTWDDTASEQRRVVALKFLRQVMVQNVREKLLKRLQDEVVAWYRLDHANILPLFGIVQRPNTVGMVSPWCENGTIAHYIRRNPNVDRLNLLAQVASGVAYLHSFNPAVIHGDLKGGNILIGDDGQPLITDFGLSKVVEDLSDSLHLGTSFFAGSTRWMAPELVFTLVEDDGRPPIVTTRSDVYSFASVCFEVVTGKLPFCHRSNDHAVLVDILRGVPPSLGISTFSSIKPAAESGLWSLLHRCWDQDPSRRPSMHEAASTLQTLDNL
ncbi:kinase-like protein [Pleurotus eryngii]|uniref:Kinase-like protein n=1 Tax=Pleurotus eryngii TaxID=5323 RepID=A0A9P6A0C0_PLEER|nr:kinase-like protein [Pleurotus eryngii]